MGCDEVTRAAPLFAPDEGLDVQVHRYVLRGYDGDSDAARQVVGAGVNHVALAFEDPLREDEHGPDYRF